MRAARPSATQLEIFQWRKRCFPWFRDRTSLRRGAAWPATRAWLSGWRPYPCCTTPAPAGGYCDLRCLWMAFSPSTEGKTAIFVGCGLSFRHPRRGELNCVIVGGFVRLWRVKLERPHGNRCLADIVRTDRRPRIGGPVRPLAVGRLVRF